MKKAVFMFIIAALVLVAAGVWMFFSPAVSKTFDVVSLAVILLLILFAVFAGFRRLGSARRGEPADDELSRNLTRRTAGLSYYISLYLWLIIGFLSDKLNYETHTLIGAGIVGMAVIFAVCWLVFNFRGVRNE